MSSPEVWRWIWLCAALLFAVGELTTAGSFFLLPFALGAAVAAVVAFAGFDLAIEWVAFVGVSAASVAALRPLARRLDSDKPSDGVGARRWIGQPARVLAEIPPGTDETGLVRVGREEWRATSVDGAAVPAGAAVRVVDVTGTRLVVWPVADAPAGHTEPPSEPL